MPELADLRRALIFAHGLNIELRDLHASIAGVFARTLA